MQRAGRDEDQRPLVDRCSEGPDEQVVQPAGRVARRLGGGGLRGLSRGAPSQPAQRESERVQLLPRFCRSAEGVEPRGTAGHRDGVEPALDLQVGDQGALAEQIVQLGAGSSFGGSADAARRAAGALPDRVLQLRLAPAEVAHVPPRKRSLLDIRDDAPQLRELGRQLLVVRRPDRPEAQGAGPALLQPGQHARRLGVLERQPEPERGELLGLLAYVRAKLGRAERDAVVVQQAHAGPERGVGARALAVREREQGARVLGAHAKVDRVARADPDVLEGPSRSGGFAESERDPRSEQVRVERGHGPAGGGQGGG